MQRIRIGFLPAFFTALTIAFGVALYLRIQSYENAPEPRQRTQATRPGTADSDSSLATFEETGTVLPPLPVRRPNTSEPPSMSIVELTPRKRDSAAPAQQTRPPSQPETPKPSLISRIVQPIVKAIGGGSKSPSAAQAQQASSRSSSSGSSSSEQPSKDSSTRQDDKTSDSVPPQLLGIEFIPPQVRDGEETTLIVQAQDELSGVRSVSGTIVAPSGAVQGFACQREQETNRYVARVAVPKDAAEGLWRVNYLSMIDNASNASTFTAAQSVLPPTASFRVTSSRPDAQGPTLLAVWVDRRSIKAGEKNVIHVQAEDDKSGVNLVSGVFQSPSKYARVGFVCRAQTGSSWDCEFNSPACSDCGDWRLEQIQLQDKANNMTTLRNDNPIVSGIQMDISSDHCDSTPPALQTLALDRSAVSNAEESVITVTAKMSDDVCGVLNVSGQATGPISATSVPPRLYFSFGASGDSQTWVGRITVPRLAAKGTWRITWIQVLDRGHNLKTYSQADAVMSGAGFNVQ